MCDRHLNMTKPTAGHQNKYLLTEAEGQYGNLVSI